MHSPAHEQRRAPYAQALSYPKKTGFFRPQVHYDCVYKGLDVVSSRQSRLLGGNRTISEPFEFVAGAAVAGVSPVKIVDSAGGLFSGQGGPTPPPALSTAVLGMRAGGKVRLPAVPYS